jgi:hypothetical protein
MSQPDYVRTLSRDLELIEESTEIEKELAAVTTANEVRNTLQRHRQFYLGMSMPARAEFNTRVKDLFAKLP